MPDLSELGRQSKLATYLTLCASFVVLAALIIGYRQTNQAQQRVAELKKEQGELNAEVKSLTARRDALKQEINTYLSTPDLQKQQAWAEQKPNSPKLISKVHEEAQSLMVVDGRPIAITINYSKAEDKAEADTASKVLQAHGYSVTGVNLASPNDATHETTIRFFHYDRGTVAVGKQLVSILKDAGFSLRTEFDDEYVGLSGPDVPPPGTFEFWIGKNPSYKAPS